MNLEQFNNILFGAFKDQSIESRIKLIETEITAASEVYVEAAFAVLDELENKSYESEAFDKVKNIKSNIEDLLQELEDLEKKVGIDAVPTT